VRVYRSVAAIALALVLGATAAAAQDYPNSDSAVTIDGGLLSDSAIGVRRG
jgi:hypothetical protein